MRKLAIIPALTFTAILCAAPMAHAVDIFGWKPFGSKKAEKTEPANINDSAAQQELRSGEALEAAGKLDSAL